MRDFKLEVNRALYFAISIAAFAFGLLLILHGIAIVMTFTMIVSKMLFNSATLLDSYVNYIFLDSHLLFYGLVMVGLLISTSINYILFEVLSQIRGNCKEQRLEKK